MPVTVTVTVPVAAVAPAVKVSVLVLLAGLGLNEAVTPLGSPDAERVGLPLKALTVIVLVPSPPGAIVTADGVANRLGGAPASATAKAPNTSATTRSNHRVRRRAPIRIARKAAAGFNRDPHDRGTSRNVEAVASFIGSLALGKAATYTETQNKVKPRNDDQSQRRSIANWVAE